VFAAEFFAGVDWFAQALNKSALASNASFLMSLFLWLDVAVDELVYVVSLLICVAIDQCAIGLHPPLLVIVNGERHAASPGIKEGAECASKAPGGGVQGDHFL